jgi:hypothetical protein
MNYNYNSDSESECEPRPFGIGDDTTGRYMICEEEHPFENYLKWEFARQTLEKKQREEFNIELTKLNDNQEEDKEYYLQEITCESMYSRYMYIKFDKENLDFFDVYYLYKESVRWIFQKKERLSNYDLEEILEGEYAEMENQSYHEADSCRELLMNVF